MMVGLSDLFYKNELICSIQYRIHIFEKLKTSYFKNISLKFFCVNIFLSFLQY